MRKFGQEGEGKEFWPRGKELSRGQETHCGWSPRPREFHDGPNFRGRKTAHKIWEGRISRVRVSAGRVRGWKTGDGQALGEDSAERGGGDGVMPTRILQEGKCRG